MKIFIVEGVFRVSGVLVFKQTNLVLDNGQMQTIWWNTFPIIAAD
jgi:hypothetical protein